MDNNDKLSEYKTTISESIEEIIRVLILAHKEILPIDKLNEVTAEVLIDILFKELAGIELETRSILSDIITENNTSIVLSDKDLELYKMITVGKA